MKYFLLLSCVVVTACNSNTTTATSTDTTGTATSAPVQADTAAAIVAPSCYAYQTSNNIVSLKLNTVLPDVSGKLTYDFLGKDKNEGTVSGTMHGDTLFADFKFMSQGKQVVRHVAFLRRGKAFVEGSGEMKQSGDATMPATSDSLQFNGVILGEVSCTEP